jgi:putative Holliday junction resolvase
MRILGLDYGERRIGAALSDELEVAAHPQPTIECSGQELEQIARLVTEHGVGRIVVGLPLRMDGSEGPAARKVRGFVKELRRRLPDADVTTMDERLTTAQAHRVLSEMGASMRARRGAVDRMAAQIILQRYLDSRAAARKAAGGEGPLMRS